MKNNMPPRSALPNAQLENQRVFLRADLNVSLQNGAILNDFRIHAVMPTIDLILKKKGTIILATHLGRPDGYEKNLSTEQLLTWFLQRNYRIIFAKNPEEATVNSKNHPNSIILLENLRFFPGEQAKDQAFANALAHTADYYVNDAFASLHNNDTSLTLLPALFDKEKKTIGLLIEKELATLHRIRHNPVRPFLVILGGGKPKKKLPFIKSIMSYADSILLCPALVFSILKALGKPVGKSLVEQSTLADLKKLLEEPSNYKIEIPLDFQAAKNSIDGQLFYTKNQEIPDNAIGIAIGPKTIKCYKKYIANAGTIFFNGPMGFFDRPETMDATNQLLHALAASTAYTVLGGGDSITAAFNLNIATQIDFISTGGGATLAYLSDESLTALQYVLN